MAHDLKTELHDAEARLLKELRDMRRGLRAQTADDGAGDKLSLGQRLADIFAAGLGSWRFIIIQSVVLFFWIMANLLAWKYKWDPYPFIFLNLMLSFQAAYAAPFIMMSQNRQQEIDRRKAENDYNVNIKAELEIELLHQKIDELRAKEMLALTQAISDLTQHVKDENLAVTARAARTSGGKAATAPKAPTTKAPTDEAPTAKAATAPKTPAAKTPAAKAVKSAKPAAVKPVRKPRSKPA